MKKLPLSVLLYFIPLYGFIAANNEAKKEEGFNWNSIYLGLLVIIEFFYMFICFIGITIYTNIKVFVEKTWSFENVINTLFIFIVIVFFACMIIIAKDIWKTIKGTKKISN